MGNGKRTKPTGLYKPDNIFIFWEYFAVDREQKSATSFLCTLWIPNRLLGAISSFVVELAGSSTAHHK